MRAPKCFGSAAMVITTNLFVAVEPKGGHRQVSVTEHRGKSDFVAFVSSLLQDSYAAAKLLRRVEFHHTPKHASWLNMAEIEIGVLTRQCRDRRLGDRAALGSEVAAWQRHRNDQRKIFEWTFTRQDADRK